MGRKPTNPLLYLHGSPILLLSEYTVRVDSGSGDVRERSFTFGGVWPDFPDVTAPVDAATNVPVPATIAWQQVANAGAIGIDLYTLDDLEDDFWGNEYAPDTTSAVIPAD